MTKKVFAVFHQYDSNFIFNKGMRDVTGYIDKKAVVEKQTNPSKRVRFEGRDGGIYFPKLSEIHTIIP